MANKRVIGWNAPEGIRRFAAGDLALDENDAVLALAAENMQAAVDDVCGGRLTPRVTSHPVADDSGVSTIYYTPYTSDRITLFDGTYLRRISFSETSLALGTLVNAQAYDVFGYYNNGSLALETAEWANGTVTMTIASPCVVTWSPAPAALATGASVTFTTSSALPTGVTANTQYFVNKTGSTTFNLAISLANLAAGTYVNTSGSQSGTHTGHSPVQRSSSLTFQNGALYKNGSPTRRWLGSFVTT
jgi:hypothetical protein